MFCPNCGTQNPDAAQTCSKCNFNIKGAAAPKFKGTMLMMNQPIPGAPPGVGPQAPAAPAAAPPVAAAPAPAPGGAGPSGVPSAAGARSPVANKLKGTMVGVAPMSGGAAPAPVFPATAPMAAVPAAQAPGMGAPMGGAARSTPAPPPGMGAPMMSPPGQAGVPGFDPQQPMQQPPAYAPPQGHQGVNPLGGTVAADGGFAQFAQQAAAAAAAAGTPNPYAQPGQYGAPPQQPYGAPPGGAPYGAPPGQYGSNPPPGGQPGYGAPPQGAPGYGGNPMSPQGGMMPYGGAAGGAPALMAGTLPSAGAAGAGPTRRNALMTFLMPFGVAVLGNVLANILGRISPGLGGIGSLIGLAGFVWYIVLASQMVNELKAITGNAGLPWWPLIVPFYNLYWQCMPLRQEVIKAKQVRGVQTPARGAVLYFFPYLVNLALAADLNDLAR